MSRGSDYYDAEEREQNMLELLGWDFLQWCLEIGFFPFSPFVLGAGSDCYNAEEREQNMLELLG